MEQSQQSSSLLHNQKIKDINRPKPINFIFEIQPIFFFINRANRSGSMWPFNKKKGIRLSPGEGMEMEFVTQWRSDKNEVIIMTKEGPIFLNENNELFISIEADNMDPVKLQIVPDFKNKLLNFVEIIDPNVPKKFADTNSPKFRVTRGFASANKPKFIIRGMVNERNLSISDYLKEWDNDLEKFGKSAKDFRRIRNIFVPLNILLGIYNLYLFSKTTDMVRYINLAAGLFVMFVTYYLWKIDKKYHNELKEYKEMRENAFGIVKNK